MLGFLLWLSLVPVIAQDDLCEVLDLKNCSGVSKMARRSSAQSLPSSSTAAQFNPANVSHDRGIGGEVMYQPGQAPTISIVSGTGKTGAALVSSKIENAFFGNRVIELDEDYLARREDSEQYDGEKQTLAASVALFKNRTGSLDLGVMGKYNPAIKRLNPGVGLSGRVWNFTFGASTYQDDVHLKFKDQTDLRTGIPYNLLFEDDEYSERFHVQSYFMGVKVKNLFVDVGHIHTRYRFYPGEVDIHLYSAAYIYKKFLFNLALRHENSPAWKFNGDDVVDEPRKTETYAGVQYSFTPWLIVGVHHNYYLLRELAMSATVFF